MYEQKFGCTNMHADRQTDRRTDERTDRQTDRRKERWTDGWMDGLTHTPSRTRASTHTNASMLTRTHDALRSFATTDGHTHTCSYGGKYLSTNMKVRSKKLEVRNKKCRECIDERMHVRTNIWTHEHARGRTLGRTQTYALMHARMQTHECIH